MLTTRTGDSRTETTAEELMDGGGVFELGWNFAVKGDGMKAVEGGRVSLKRGEGIGKAKRQRREMSSKKEHARRVSVLYQLRVLDTIDEETKKFVRVLLTSFTQMLGNLYSTQIRSLTRSAFVMKDATHE